jgi:antitoxin CcdA
LAFARENGLNVSAIAEDALRTARREAWLRENAQALEERKAWIEKNGLPLAQYQGLKI